MADITNVFNAIWPIFTCISVFSVKNVLGDYCEFGLCDKEQYCCGLNRCCNKTLDLWFFWAAIVLVFFALAVAAGIGHSRCRRNNIVNSSHSQYIPVPTHPVDDIVTTNS